MEGTPYIRAQKQKDWNSTLGYLKLSLHDFDFKSKDKKKQLEDAHKYLQLKNPYYANLRLNNPSMTFEDKLNHIPTIFADDKDFTGKNNLKKLYKIHYFFDKV